MGNKLVSILIVITTILMPAVSLMAAKTTYTETVVAKAPLGAEAGTAVPSPDGKRAVFIQGLGGAFNTYLEGKKGAQYQQIEPIGFNADGSHFAYLVSRERDPVLVFDEVASRTYNFLLPDDFRWSSDGKRYGYRARDKEDDLYFYVIDGKEGTHAADVAGLVFSKNGATYAFALQAKLGGSWVLILNGKIASKEYEGIGPIALSPDGTHVAFGASQNGTAFVVADGSVSPNYEKIKELSFTPDGKQFGFIATKGGRSGDVWVFGDQESTGWQSMKNLSFSADSKKLLCNVYHGGTELWLCLIDDKRMGDWGKQFGSQIYVPFFSPDLSRIANVYVAGGRRFGVVDGYVATEKIEAINMLNFTPDSKHVVFLGVAWDPESKKNTRIVGVDLDRGPKVEGFFGKPGIVMLDNNKFFVVGFRGKEIIRIDGVIEGD
ncbi:MAG: hypothetical protein JNM63_00190 [Spirochaetia bacterium]|nr:hypothetical protein [Spirochaetia bacterium]